jgi:hypothetical protein
MYLNGPAIARLLACSRMTANEHMRAGHFGPLLHRGRVAYAAVEAIERHAGQRFDREQIEAAVVGFPARCFTPAIPEVQDGQNFSQA